METPCFTFVSSITSSPSPQDSNVSHITALTGRQCSPPITAFLRSDDTSQFISTEVNQETKLNITLIIKMTDDLHAVVQNLLLDNCKQMQDYRNRNELPNFCEEEFVLTASDTFYMEEKRCLRLRRPSLATKVLSDNVFQVEDVCDKPLDTINGIDLKYYLDASRDTTSIMSHVRSSETDMSFSPLLNFLEAGGNFYVTVRWKGLSREENTAKTLSRFYEDIYDLLL